jgi:hypothetical protein
MAASMVVGLRFNRRCNPRCNWANRDIGSVGKRGGRGLLGVRTGVGPTLGEDMGELDPWVVSTGSRLAFNASRVIL